MKILDEKGRLFGKLNLIDLIAILLVVAAVAVLGIRFLGKPADPYVGQEMVTVDYTVLCRSVPNELIEGFKGEVGEQLMAAGSMVDGCYITNVEILPAYIYLTSETAEDGYIMAESQQNVDVLFTISGIAPKKNNAFSVGTQEIRIGKSHIVKTINMEYTGTILTLEVAYG